MKTFTEFYQQKLLNEAHKATPQELAQLGLDPNAPDFYRKLADFWVKYGKANPTSAQFMASKGYLPDEFDTKSNQVGTGAMSMDSPNMQAPKGNMPLPQQKNIERQWK